MLPRLLIKFHLNHIEPDLVSLAFINGISGMALNGAAIFGMLAVLSGSYFLHGLSGLSVYVALSASSTFIGYYCVCHYAASLNLKIRTVLYAVFGIHALGFLGAAFIHPICLALSAGAGLGIFYSVFMLKSLTGIDDKSRDGYATITGLIIQSASLIAPFLGAAMLYVGTKMGFHNNFLPTFLTFALCVLCAVPLIRGLPNIALPYHVSLPLRAVFNKAHLPAMGLYISTVACECLMNPMLIIASFAILGKVVEVGWFSFAITLVAFFSLLLSHRVRIPGKRWITLGGMLIIIGCAFLLFDLIFTFKVLLVIGAIYALCRVNYSATWFAFASRIVEKEWGQFGKNQALIVGETFVLGARLCVACLFMICSILDISLKKSLTVMTIFFILSALCCLMLARYFDMKYKLTTQIEPKK